MAVKSGYHWLLYHLGSSPQPRTPSTWVRLGLHSSEKTVTVLPREATARAEVGGLGGGCIHQALRLVPASPRSQVTCFWLPCQDGKEFWYSHFADEETEAQRGSLKVAELWAGELGINSRYWLLHHVGLTYDLRSGPTIPYSSLMCSPILWFQATSGQAHHPPPHRLLPWGLQDLAQPESMQGGEVLGTPGGIRSYQAGQSF